MSELNFVDGIPTAPDVARLMEEYKLPAVGTVITHLSIEEILRQSRKTCRYKSVTHIWRKKLYRDHNIILGPVKGVGFKSLDPEERVVLVGSKHKKGIRQLKGAHAIANCTDTSKLSPEALRSLNHYRLTSAALILADATAVKQLPPIT